MRQVSVGATNIPLVEPKSHYILSNLSDESWKQPNFSISYLHREHPIEKLRAFSTHLYSSVSRLFRFRPINFLTPSRILMWKFLKGKKSIERFITNHLSPFFSLPKKVKNYNWNFENILRDSRYFSRFRIKYLKKWISHKCDR